MVEIKEETGDFQMMNGKASRSVPHEAASNGWMEEKPRLSIPFQDEKSLREEKVNLSLLPDSPPRSPYKDEQALLVAELDQKRSSSSRQPSPRRVAKGNGKGPTQFAHHLPRADSKALSTFDRLKGNVYQNSKVGRSRGHEKEAMICECRYRHGVDDESEACADNCINRLTQVECLKSECHCGQYCQNQRFQRGEYGDVEIVETEKKGFGLRAGADLAADQFIYEYIGEVVEQKEFVKRMEQYRNEGIRHFYFMMLQREEFLDATRKGGIARFINHSCNPNCYVSKWHVGKYMRMGIFAKRSIQSGEELTFNYNVDRYGNDAQTCYCGEPNCVGSIGGKTQTDLGGMDQLFIDALGIADEVDQLEARGSRKKRSRHLDEDFTPLLRPITKEEEVAKVITALRQATSNRRILQKLLSRIHMTQDTAVQRSLVRLHGFVLMAGIMEEWEDDKEIVLLTMGSLARWPLLAKNKVLDSGMDKIVTAFSQAEDAEVSSLAMDLLKAWDELDLQYRIARRKEGQNAGEDATEEDTPGFLMDDEMARKWKDAKAPNSVSNRLDAVAPRLSSTMAPLSSQQLDALRKSEFWALDSPGTPGSDQMSPLQEIPIDSNIHSPVTAPRPRGRSPVRIKPSSSAPIRRSPARDAAVAVQRVAPKPLSIEEIIRRANESEALQRKQLEEAAEAKRIADAEKTKLLQSNGHSSNKRSASSLSRPHSDKKVRESVKNDESAADRRLKRLVGEIVVSCMSIFRDRLEREVFKKHARELTHLICGKERRSHPTWPPHDKFEGGLTKEKTRKIRSFAMDYIKKLVARKGKGVVDPGPVDKGASVDSGSTPIATSVNGQLADGDEGEDDDSASLQLSGDGDEDREGAHSTTTISPSANESKSSIDQGGAVPRLAVSSDERSPFIPTTPPR